jgi:hypothetical protein
MIRISLILMYFASTCFPQDNCTVLNDRINSFINDMEASETNEPDINHYLAFKNLYTEHVIKIKKMDCPQSDSLEIEIMYFYALFIVKPQGDLERFKNLFENCSILIEGHKNRLLENVYPDKRNINDEIRKKWLPRKTKIQNNLDELNNSYANLNIYLHTEPPLKEMTKVFTLMDGVKSPVKIHFRPPEEIMNDDVMKRRLAFLSNDYEMILTDYDNSHGFYFSIPLVPLSQNEEPDPNQTYAITFDEKARYRLQEFNAETQSSLYIQALPDWVFQEIIPENYSKIVIPKNIEFDIIDKLTGDNLSKSSFTIIEFGDETVFYLPILKTGSDNIGIRFKDDSKYWFWVMTMMSTLIILGATLYV